MKNTLYMLALAVVLALSAAPGAQAAGMYIAPKFLDSLQNTGSVGGSEGLSSQTWNTVGAALALGLDLREFTEVGMPVRVEMEYASRGMLRSEWNASLGDRQALKAAWQVQTLLANGYWDIETETSFTPYIGAGIGAAHFYESMTSGPAGARHSSSDTNWGLAWNVGGGVAYAFNESTALDVGYRFIGFGESSLKHGGNSVDNYMTANEFMAGLRVSF